VKTRWVRLALLSLIAGELVGAVLVTRWALDLGAAEQPQTVNVDPTLPASLVGAIQDWIGERPDMSARTAASEADVLVGWQRRPGARLLAEVVLVPVAPFSSRREDVSFDELRRAWLGRPRPGDKGLAFLVAPDTAGALDALLGPRGAGSPVTVVPAADLADRLWAEPGTLGLVPFDRLAPRLQVLTVDGLSALDRDLDQRRYPLLATVWVHGPAEVEEALIAEIEDRGLDTNRRLDHLTILDMSGVTALTRGVALEIEARGDPAWPARGLADTLSAADLTHVSHEVSFMPGCQPQAEAPAFCAKPAYLETLRLLGADLVELTGNHNLDFGPEYALLSLDLYAEAGMRTFGGGRNAAEARQPLIVNHNGNRLAFLGYNAYGPSYAWAGEDSPGAARFSREAVQADLAGIQAQADVVFVSIQYTETYETAPLPQQVADFRAVVEAGADVVIGSQAHQPQAVEFHGDGLILYGLGNLIFDQTWSEPTRQSLIARHYVYDGRLIATQLIPTVMGDDLQPRPAGGDERESILRTVFAASGW
jgi:hypothetical protein